MTPLTEKAAAFAYVLQGYRQGRSEEEACIDLLSEAMHFMALNRHHIGCVLGMARMHFEFEADVYADEEFAETLEEIPLPF